MASQTPIKCSLSVLSSLLAVEKIYIGILSALKENGYSKEDIFAVHLAFEEAFANAVRHGNKMDGTKEIKIDYCVSADKAEVYIKDEGKGFCPNSVPDPRNDENLYKTDGRGLLLIRSYMDIAEFNEQGNCIHLVRYKRTGPAEQDK